MSVRNWEAELAKIDKQLASVSDEALLAESKDAAAEPRTEVVTSTSEENVTQKLATATKILEPSEDVLQV